MDSRRITAASILTALLLVADAFWALAHAGEHGLGHDMSGAGVGALASTLFAFAFLDAGMRDYPGIERGPLTKLTLAALVWAFWRVGNGDVAMIPAVVGMSWVLFVVTLWTPIEEDEEDKDVDSSPDENGEEESPAL